MSETMRAIEIKEPGDPDVLHLCARPIPTPAPGEVLLRVAWAGINRPDALQRAGSYAPPPDASDLPGLEAAGEVVAVGEGVFWPCPGEMVCALLPGGGYAEYATAPAAHCLPIPQGMSLRDAACLPETFFTVWSNVFQRGALMPGETFLVHGGTSGIGTTAIQLAAHFGARVFATAGSDEKCRICEELGAEQAINYREKDFVQVLKAVGGADVILDMVGADYISRNIRCMRSDGRLVMIAFLNGPKAEVNFAQVMVKRLILTGSTLRPQSDAAKAEIAASLRNMVWPLLDSGKLKPVIDSEFALPEAADAHRRMESSAHIGKIVLRVQ